MNEMHIYFFNMWPLNSTTADVIRSESILKMEDRKPEYPANNTPARLRSTVTHPTYNH